MQTKTPNRQQGIAHLGLILALVVVLGAVGFAGYRVFSGKKSPATSAVENASRIAAEQACTEADKNICKFLASWKVQNHYTMQTTSTTDGQTSQSTYKSENQKRFQMTTSGEMAFDVIVIDNDTYTKAADGTWWKQTNKPEEAEKFSQRQDFGDTSTSSDEPAAPESKTTYKNLGKEACGKLNCFKYQIIESDAPDDKEFVWFDDKDYQLRKSRTESKNGDVHEATYSYDKVTIAVPSPVKELGPNQYLMPGSSEPTTLPDAGSYQDYLNSLPTEE